MKTTDRKGLSLYFLYKQGDAKYAEALLRFPAQFRAALKEYGLPDCRLDMYVDEVPPDEEAGMTMWQRPSGCRIGRDREDGRIPHLIVGCQPGIAQNDMHLVTFAMTMLYYEEGVTPLSGSNNFEVELPFSTAIDRLLKSEEFVKLYKRIYEPWDGVA